MMRKRIQHKIRATMLTHRKVNHTTIRVADSYKTVKHILNRPNGKIDKI